MVRPTPTLTVMNAVPIPSTIEIDLAQVLVSQEEASSKEPKSVTETGHQEDHLYPLVPANLSPRSEIYIDTQPSLSSDQTSTDRFDVLSENGHCAMPMDIAHDARSL
jgi:hypothetical protein